MELAQKKFEMAISHSTWDSDAKDCSYGTAHCYVDLADLAEYIAPSSEHAYEQFELAYQKVLPHCDESRNQNDPSWGLLRRCDDGKVRNAPGVFVDPIVRSCNSSVPVHDEAPSSRSCGCW